MLPLDEIKSCWKLDTFWRWNLQDLLTNCIWDWESKIFSPRISTTEPLAVTSRRGWRETRGSRLSRTGGFGAQRLELLESWAISSALIPLPQAGYCSVSANLMEIYAGSSCCFKSTQECSESGRREEKKNTNHMGKAQETEPIVGMLISTKTSVVTSEPPRCQGSFVL